jgi:hypothetical protein
VLPYARRRHWYGLVVQTDRCGPPEPPPRGIADRTHYGRLGIGASARLSEWPVVASATTEEDSMAEQVELGLEDQLVFPTTESGLKA